MLKPLIALKKKLKVMMLKKCEPIKVFGLGEQDEPMTIVNMGPNETILPPIKETTEDYEEIEKCIIALFKTEIYLPLLREMGLGSKTLKNAPQDLADAIRSGRITFYRGEFRGRFSSAITRELKKIGAKWDRRQGSFKIQLSSLTPEIKHAIETSENRFLQTISRIDKKLREILPEEIADRLNISDRFDSVLWKVDKEFRKSIKGITVAPDLTPERRKKIAEEYTNNMRLYIKEWTEKEIVKLRKDVQSKAFAGNRYETMVKTIQKSFGVSQNKAKFLARQETSLLITKFKETRYTDAGVREYIWSCVAGSTNHPVRPMHKKLEGKRFRWDDPPITDEKGNRNNPGQDYNCRCFARPVVKF